MKRHFGARKLAIQQITIVGTGLIGASFGLAVKAAGFRGSVVGYDRSAVLKQAQALGAIDTGSTGLLKSVRGSQVVLLAVPVSTIIEFIDRLKPVLPEDCLLTDVGSTKAQIMARAEAVFGVRAAARFLGGHPIAGKEHAGVQHASRNLFRGAAWLMTPAAGQRLNTEPISTYLQLLRRIGARVISVNAEQHDRLCAWISHTPQMIATALASAIGEEFGAPAGKLALSDVDQVAGRALREMTRVASSPYAMWRDIAATNRANLEAALLAVEQRLAHIRNNLDTRELEVEFERGHRFRRSQMKSP